MIKLFFKFILLNFFQHAMLIIFFCSPTAALFAALLRRTLVQLAHRATAASIIQSSPTHDTSALE
jgi:hypothetical protein